MRILIIDDDRAHGESLSDLLNSRGHEAYFAPSLSEATWLFDLFRFDLAILDHDMPDLTGPQVARKLRTGDPAIRTILMSARESNRESCRALGSVPFLDKPIDVDRLLKLIGDLASPEASSLILRLSFPLERYRGKAR
ncbi:MAG: response regulator [Planctomycetota bacterium]|nr:response regulator [Planctomycetota bacterium]